MTGPASDGRPSGHVLGLLAVGVVFATVSGVLANLVTEVSRSRVGVVFAGAVLAGLVAAVVTWRVHNAVDLSPADPVPNPPPLDQGGRTHQPVVPGQRVEFLGKTKRLRVTGWLFAGGVLWTVLFWPLALLGHPIGAAMLIGLAVDTRDADVLDAIARVQS
jgi:hypothetical protein